MTSHEVFAIRERLSRTIFFVGQVLKLQE